MNVIYDCYLANIQYTVSPSVIIAGWLGPWSHLVSLKGLYFAIITAGGNIPGLLHHYLPNK